MKAYVHNPEIFRRHFKQQVGSAIPGFRGMRMQRGHGLGLLLGKLARSAIPLIKAGVKAAAPHAKKVAKEALKEVTPHLKKAGQQAVQSITTKAVQKLANAGNKRPKQRKQPVRRKKNNQRTTSYQDRLS